MPFERANDPDAFRTFEHGGWEEVSAGYARHFTRLTSQTLPALLDAAGVAAGARVLDLCAGPGMVSRAALERGAQAVGLDFSAAAVAIAQRNVPGAEFRQGDAQDLPFADDSFDSVICAYGVMHVADPEQALAEMRRVLKRGGRAALSVWSTPRPDNGLGVVFGAVRRHGDPNVPLPHGPDFFQFSESAVLKAVLIRVGFADIRAQRVEQSWRMEDSAGLIAAIAEGTVRARALLRGQTLAARQAIEAAIERAMAQFRTPDGSYLVAMPALVGAGRK